MRKFAAVVIVATFAAPAAHSAEPVSFSPAALTGHLTGGGHWEHLIPVFPSGEKEFDIPIPLVPRWFAYGTSGLTLYATALKQTGARSFTTQPGLFKIEVKPVHVSPIPGLDGFYSVGPFAVSQGEDFIVFEGAKGNYRARSCGVYEIGPAWNARAIVETSDCSAGSPWRVLSHLRSRSSRI